MSNLYPAFKQFMIDSLATGVVKAALMKASANYNAAHDFLDDISVDVVATATLTGKSVTNGVFDATDVVFPNVPSGAAVDAVVLYIDSGTAATSRLVVWLDGVSLTPNGANMNGSFSNAAEKIFAV